MPRDYEAITQYIYERKNQYYDMMARWRYESLASTVDEEQRRAIIQAQAAIDELDQMLLFIRR